MAWFIGNIYEGMVDLPQLLAYARAERPSGLLGAGSPVRYFGVVAPIVLISTATSLVQDWKVGDNRHVVGAQAAVVLNALGLNAYLIRSVNTPLLEGSGPLIDPERSDLCTKWHRINAVRIALIGAALLLHRFR